MIFITLKNYYYCEAKKKGYYYRNVFPANNPLAKASNIEYMPEDEQLRMFRRIDRENENLFVFGADGESLLREIFIKPHLDKDGYIKVQACTFPLKAEYKGFKFEYMLSFDVDSVEDLERLKAVEKVNDMLDKAVLGIVEGMIEEHKT